MSHRDAAIREFQHGAGIEPATGRRCELIEKMKEKAAGLIELLVEILRSNTDEGFKAWVERKKAKQATQTEAKAKKPMSEKQRAALDAARRAKLLKQLPISECSDA
jgi:hypothetical protein